MSVSLFGRAVRRPSPFLVSLLVLLLVTPVPSFADEPKQEEAPPPPPPAQQLNEEITVTATRTARRLLDTAGNVSIIDAQAIEERMAADRADLVRYEAGVFVGNDPTRLGQNGLNIRGIGGNRVLTQIDGIRTAEQFDFGPLGITQVGLDVDALKTVEIVRSAGSSLYGSDAIGGVVTLLTKDPADYLAGNGDFFAQARLTYDSRASERSENGVVAWSAGRWQASLFASRRDGEAMSNMGSVETSNALRTAPNPIDRATTTALGKLTFTASDSSLFELGLEVFDADQATQVFSGQGIQDLSGQFPPGATYTIDTQRFNTNDEQNRRRVSLEHNLTSMNGALFDTLLWRVYSESSNTDQVTDELRVTTMGGGPLGPIRVTRAQRDATFEFDQDRHGGEVQFHRGIGPADANVLTWGGSFIRNSFDMLRGRVDTNPATGAVIPSSTPHPTKYFPASVVTEAGAYVQDEILLRSGRMRVIPGLRYDRYSLNPDENDAIFLSGNPGTPPVEATSVGALSPRLAVIHSLGTNASAFVQYAHGFRSPPYSDVNNGFTNLAFGYTTLPNPDLKPETSDNFEIGLRAATSRFGGSIVVFDNRFSDFIETVTVGVTPQGLIEFQPQNVAEARIRGLEVSGQALLGRDWQLRASTAVLRGDNESADVPLNSIPPTQLNLGLRYAAPSSRWGSELALTLAAAKDDDRLDRTIVQQFAAPSYQVIDLTGYYDLSRSFRLQLGLFNLLDETYWRWSDVQGQVTGSPVLDRYTSPGRSASVSVRARL